MHPVLERIRQATEGTAFGDDLWLVGGAVRDELLGLPPAGDFDLVTRGSAIELANLLYERGVSDISPVTYERFGTAMIQIEGVAVELVTARRESYDQSSRKPRVETASLEEDAARRDFTANALMRSLATGELRDPLGTGLADLQAKILRTPLEPRATFVDDPLRMLRAVRFRWKLGFTPAPGLYEAIKDSRGRLAIVSFERMRDEIFKMLLAPTAANAFGDLMDLGLFEVIAPEFLAMVGCEQGSFHHLDVWNHTLLVVRNAGAGDLCLTLGALFHDVGKPATRFVDEQGNTRFFGHESVGAQMATAILRRWKLPERDIADVSQLVRHHMRLGSAPEFSAAAARRLLRDLDGNVERLLQLVEADAASLAPGVRRLDLQPIRKRLAEVEDATPVKSLRSPLSGQEIMDLTGLPAGPEVGRLKELLVEAVLDGRLLPDDGKGAADLVWAALRK